MLTSRAKGVMAMVPVLDLGVTLSACESLVGFGPVLTRLKNGEDGARSELEFAAALVKREYTPELEPRVGAKCPDASIAVGEDIVYVEVVRPDLSSDSRKAMSAIRKLSDGIMKLSRPERVEVYLLDDITTEASEQILGMITSAPTTDIDATRRSYPVLRMSDRALWSPTPALSSPFRTQGRFRC